MRYRILLGLTLVLLVPGLAYFLHWRSVRTVSVNGKPILEWTVQLNGPNGIERAEEAIRKSGSAGVPALIRALEAKDSLFKKPFLAVADKLPDRMRIGLHRMLNPYEKERLRLGAVRALEILGSKAEQAIPSLGRALKDSNAEISMHAAIALGRIGEPGIPILIEALNETDDTVRYMAIEGLARAGPAAHEAVPTLIAALTDTNKKISEQATKALGRIGNDGSVGSLTKMIESPELRTRMMAYRTLADLGPRARQAVPALIEAARKEEPGARQGLIDALGKIQPSNPSVVAILRTALSDADYRIRETAAEGLNRSGTASNLAVPDLIQALNDTNAEVRRTATMALGTAVSQNPRFSLQIVPALASNLSDKDFLVRLYSARSLAGLGPDAAFAIEALSHALKDPHPGVRSWAALALGAIGPKAFQAYEGLSELLSDPDKAVSGAARKALNRIRGDSGTR